MPQSIYEGKTYIGEGIRQWNGSAWVKIPVLNRVGLRWIQLNAAVDRVDFAITQVLHNEASIEIFDYGNFDHVGPYEVFLKTGAGSFVRTPQFDIPDNSNRGKITGLAANTSYTVRIRTALVSGGYTPDSDQTFTTAASPLPLAPRAVSDLRSPNRTNSWIDLAWTNPAGTTATFYRVVYGRAGSGPVASVQLAPGALTARISGLSEDTRYWYIVRGVNSAGLEGPDSNRLQWATGWGEIRRKGSDRNLVWKPREWGSWRPDIGWKWSRENQILPKNPHLYQGYWPGNNWHGASNPTANIEAGKRKRNFGCVVYSRSGWNDALDAKHGAGVSRDITMTKTAFRSLYRHEAPGINSAVDMVWYLTNTDPFNSGSQPPIYDRYSAVAEMRTGQKIDLYKLDPTWGTKLTRGFYNGTAVNGICLHRTDDSTNGYGAAGYGRWSGHLLKDPDMSGSWRFSDLSLVMEGSWDILVRAYKGPYQW